jgi:hypothetical protein
VFISGLNNYSDPRTSFRAEPLFAPEKGYFGNNPWGKMVRLFRQKKKIQPRENSHEN